MIMLEKYMTVISKSRLFDGCTDLAEKLPFEFITLDRGNSLSRSEKLCLLLSGRAASEYLTYDGRRLFVSCLVPSDVCDLSRFVVSSHQNGTVLLLLQKSRITDLGDGALLHNLLKISSDSEERLLSRLECASMPTLRQKILTFFRSRSEPLRIFSVPETREQLAEYLNANRSALSRELSLMKKDGIIDYDGNYFKVLKPY